MASMVYEGCRVSVPATFFDLPGTTDAEKLSLATFGPQSGETRCSGQVMKVLFGEKYDKVKWVINQRVERVGVEHLQIDSHRKESDKDNSRDDDLDRDDEPDDDLQQSSEAG